MPRGSSRSSNGLAQAVQMVIQLEATAQIQSTLMGERLAVLEAEVKQRLDRLEADMRLVLQIFRDLPEAFREKMGFQPPKVS